MWQTCLFFTAGPVIPSTEAITDNALTNCSVHSEDDTNTIYQDQQHGGGTTYARFTLADPIPRLCPDAVGSANVNGLPTPNQPSGPHREAIGGSSGNIKHV